jgi:thioredoxin-like negative regulator of GroEL
MLVQLTAAAVAVYLVVTSPAAEACDNAVRAVRAVQWKTNEYDFVLVHAEKQLDAGQYAHAWRTLIGITFPTAALREREMNIIAILLLRSGNPPLDADTLVSHFKARTEAKKTQKDVRNRAWLAEAYILAGKPDEARTILVDLHKRDLMPDAYAYHALAKLSSGTERDEYYKACRTRAENKDLCELPAKVEQTSVQAQR